MYLSSIIDFYDPSYFQNEEIRFVMDGIVAFFQETNKIPKSTELQLRAVSEAEKLSLANVIRYMAGLDTEYDINQLLKMTEQFLREKAVYNALLTTTESMARNDIDTNRILDTFNSACSISLIDNLGLDFLESINKIADDLVSPTNVIPSGWKWLDQRIGGGFQAEGKALYVFTGFTNVGKSIFLGNIAMNMLRENKTVVLVTLEMPESLYAKRICSSISSVPMDELTVKIDDMKEKLYEFKNEYDAKLIIKEFPTKGMSVHGLNAFIQKLIKKGINPDAIVVDYLNLMKGLKEGEGSYSDVKDTSEQLRASTYLFGVPIITATQLNRKGAGKEDPGMETISESIGVSFTADVQMSIWSDDQDAATGVTHLGIQKNRFGPKFCSTLLNINYNTLTLSEMEEADIPPDTISDQSIDDGGLDSALASLNT